MYYNKYSNDTGFKKAQIGKMCIRDRYNSYAIDYPYASFIVDKTNIEVAQAAIANVLSEYIPQLAYGKYDDPKAAVDEMRQKLLDAGYEDVKADLQAQMDAYKAQKEAQ